MARQRVSVKVNQLVDGINTEANPLSFPEGATSDERNCELNSDGSRKRRNGFDLEPVAVAVDTGVVYQEGSVFARTQFRWENPGGINNKQFLVVQIGNYLGVHDVNSVPISGTLIYSKTFPSASYTKPFGYASINGLLVVGAGIDTLTTFKYENEVITETEGELLVRDFFGVEAAEGAVVLTEYQNTQRRPIPNIQAHIYNLRNQTFALPKVRADSSGGFSTGSNGEDPADPLTYFRNIPQNTAKVWPSNADNLLYHYYADPNITANRTIERFNALNMFSTPPNNNKAPTGYFVINALKRGVSRLEQITKLYTNNPALQSPVTVLPGDTTPGGASVLTEYAGRVWYAGFSGDVLDGDSLSPSLSAYILFSQVVRSNVQVFNCFQEADPTSIVDPDIVDTDGGFIKLDGAYGIKALMAVETSLFVFAENGIWRISGVDDNSFVATEFKVSRVSEEGCASGSSVVSSGAALFYWGYNGIYAITKDKFGAYTSTSISENTIQTLYDNISADKRGTVSGYYDPLLTSVRWVYGFLGAEESSKELILNVKYEAFTKNEVLNLESGVGILSISGGQRVGAINIPIVTSEGIVVTSNGENVTLTLPTLQREPNQSFYCVLVEKVGTLKYSFGGYNNLVDTYDWKFGGGVDSPAYLIVGSTTGGEGRLRKDVPYLHVYLKVENDGSNLQSSCLVSSQWNWTTSSLVGKFSTARQAYRPHSTDEGNVITRSRNRIRGGGDSVAFKFESEPGKTFHIYGWETTLNATSEE